MRCHRIFSFLLVLPLGLLSSACSSNSSSDFDPRDAGIQFADGAVPPPGTCEGNVCTLPDGNGTCYLVSCVDKITACGDCTDNDGDGLYDFQDPECLGPCDNYEGEELLTGIGGETGEQCKADCYFDFGNGAGNDDCHWHRSCDPLTPKVQCLYDESILGSKDCPLGQQSALCESYCAPLTPNGCDCFGCCTFPELADMGTGGSGGDGYVYIGSEEGCTFDTVTDPTHCKPCTPADSCLNTCERCELCLGKDTIPEDCLTEPDGGVGEPRCPDERQVCGLEGDDLCPPGEFCVTGCCTIVVVQ